MRATPERPYVYDCPGLDRLAQLAQYHMDLTVGRFALSPTTSSGHLRWPPLRQASGGRCSLNRARARHRVRETEQESSDASTPER
jgi:hypothetical protein